MKTWLILFIFFPMVVLAQGDLSGKLKGLSQTGNGNIFGTLQTYNSQATKTGAVNALMESNDYNFLSNPGFEASTAGTSWTRSGSCATIDPETTIIYRGLKSVSLSPGAGVCDVVQDVTPANMAQFIGKNFLLRIRVKPSNDITVCPRISGATTTAPCSIVTSSTEWQVAEIPFVIPVGATSFGISIAKPGAGTGVFILDDAYVGPQPIGYLQTVSQGQYVGSAFWPTTTSCVWSTTSTTLANFAAVAACPNPTVTGDLVAPSTKIPGFQLNARPGRYLIVANGLFYRGASATAATFAFNDGLTTSAAGAEYTGGATDGGDIGGITAGLSSAVSGLRTFQIQGSSAAGTSFINVSTVGYQMGLTIEVYYFPPPSQVISMESSDTNWQSCGHTAADFTGFGTPTAIETQCRKVGPNLEMRGAFTTGTTTAVQARLALKFQGNTLTSASSPTIGSVSGAGMVAMGTTGQVTNWALMEPSVTYITFGQQAAATTALTQGLATTVFASTTKYTLDTVIVPIQGWSQNRINATFAGLILQPGFVSPKRCVWSFGGAATTTAVPTICNSSPCTIMQNTCGTSATMTRGGIGNPVFQSGAGTFRASSLLDCQYKSFSGGDSRISPNGSASNTTLISSAAGNVYQELQVRDGVGAAADAWYQISCTGETP